MFLFYEDRYANGYLEEWPEDKKIRMREIIENLKLPEFGEALDFGCGNGIFTNILKQVLPKWNIYGADISKVAIENAKKRYPDCRFVELDDLSLRDKKFNFLFLINLIKSF